MSTLKQFQDYGLPKPNAGSREDILKNIDYLYSKIKQVSKDLTFWDLYKISSVITDKKELQPVSNALLPFTSAIINTSSAFSDGDTSYAVGDLIVKNQDGTTEHIRAERGGIFFPQTITRSTAGSNYNYTIDFVLKSNEPAKVSAASQISASGNKWDASGSYTDKVQFENLVGGAGASPYNIVYTVFSNMTFDAAATIDNPTSSDSTKIISPIVKGYNSSGEEVYWDLKVTTSWNSSEKKWKINITNPEISLISVIVVK